MIVTNRSPLCSCQLVKCVSHFIIVSIKGYLWRRVFIRVSPSHVIAVSLSFRWSLNTISSSYRSQLKIKYLQLTLSSLLLFKKFISFYKVVFVRSLCTCLYLLLLLMMLFTLNSMFMFMFGLYCILVSSLL